jgi:ABC-2 type transport system ATP-binding protein
MPPVVAASDLRKTYFSSITKQRIRALDGVSLSVEPGEIYGLLGPNGAGKTTTLNCLSLLLRPDSGEIRIFGQDVRRSPRKIRSRLNMSSGNANFPWCMTVREILKFYGYLYGLWGRALSARIDELASVLELEPFLSRRFDELSTGSKQRLALAKALINSPELLFLDEPTIGLDPHVSIKLRAFIQKVNREQGITILLTTHYMAEAEQLAHRIAFLQKGRVLALGTPEELKKQATAQNMEQVFVELSRAGEEAEA